MTDLSVSQDSETKSPNPVLSCLAFLKGQNVYLYLSARVSKHFPNNSKYSSSSPKSKSASLFKSSIFLCKSLTFREHSCAAFLALSAESREKWRFSSGATRSCCSSMPYLDKNFNNSLDSPPSFTLAHKHPLTTSPSSTTSNAFSNSPYFSLSHSSLNPSSSPFRLSTLFSKSFTNFSFSSFTFCSCSQSSMAWVSFSCASRRICVGVDVITPCVLSRWSS
mmetsp:Transcript_37824/g.59789  ORF Transcript_37824/g.59789 Transcript_37824/m.59789 type:complete len:221 (+) Transcript_37824:269-931(+)